MNRTHVLKLARVSCIAMVACLTLAGCRGCSPSPPSQGPATVDPLVVNVGGGKEAIRDLGPVAPGSRHVVVFVVDNPTDQPLVLRSVRGDCECISADNPPDRIAPQGSVRISAVYVPPKNEPEYESRLIIATDNPNRKVISLRVKSSLPAVNGAGSSGSRPAGTRPGN